METVANSTAMYRALQVREDLRSDAVLEMHRALMETSEPEVAGRFRQDQVWLGSKNHPHEADSVPPVHERVRAALDAYRAGDSTTGQDARLQLDALATVGVEARDVFSGCDLG